MEISCESSVLEHVNDLRSLVISVLPQLLKKLDLIGNKLEKSPTTPTNTPSATRVEISTQTEGEFGGGNSDEADDILEDGVRLEDLLWTEATLPGGIKVESSSEGAEGIVCFESERADNVFQGSTYDDVRQVVSCSLTHDHTFTDTVLNTPEETRTEPSVPVLEYVSESDAPDVKPDLASTSNISMNHSVTRISGNQGTDQQNRMSRRNCKRYELIDSLKKAYKCSYCSKLCDSRASVVTHERIHTGEKPFKCSYCSKSFSQRGCVAVHERSHTGEKPFRCRYCSKPFANLSSVVTHERIHTNAKPFKCSFCTKSFNHKSNAVEHERTHTGEKPFKCRFCSKTFRRQFHAVRHERVHTGEAVQV